MPFNEQPPEWNAQGVEPPLSKKNEGWAAAERPPADYWDWQMNRTFKTLQELQQKSAEKVDVGDMSTVPTTSKNAAGAITELFQSGVDGKNQLETAVLAMEGTVSKQGTIATFDELDTGIRSIPVGLDTSDATATAPEILAGETAYGPVGKIVGTMANRGAQIIVPGAADVAIPAGYHSGAGKVAGVVVPVANVKTGTTIAGQAGTMPIPGDNTPQVGLDNGGGAGFLRIAPKAGYWNGGDAVRVTEANFVPANIRTGVNMFGLVGNLVPGKPYASGSVISSTNVYFFVYRNDGTYLSASPAACVSVSGLNFPNGIRAIRLLYKLNNNAYVTTWSQDEIWYGTGSTFHTMMGNWLYASNGSTQGSGAVDITVSNNGFTNLPVSGAAGVSITYEVWGN